VTDLVPAFDQQEEVFASAFQILRQAIADRAFPAASIAVTHAGKLVVLKSFGRFTYEKFAELGKEAVAPPLSRSLRQGGNFNSEVNPSTLFDLASLTKPIATTTMAMILYERGLLELDAPVSGTLPEFLADPARDPRRRDVTFRMLLAHSSGLPAYEKLFLRAQSRDELLHAAFTTPLAADPASRAEYSDIGFILLGVALDRLAEEPIDGFCRREIFAPLAMSSTTFNPPADLRPHIPPTADERDEECGAGTPARELPKSQPQQAVSQSRSTFRHRIIQGEVQDENAGVLGGVAGHAGLFATAEDLARFAHFLISCGADTPVRESSAPSPMPSASMYGELSPILRPETIALFTRRESAPVVTTRTLGWDTPSIPSQSGKYFGPCSYGHLGYTGTSLWIDPDRQLSITLLTNRTWPGCSNQAIKQVRPRFHDAVVEALIRS
jgi:CubicO group peptidase (beta-lactamase class C family)